MLLGCSTSLYGGQPLERALSAIRAAGYRAIELAALSGVAEHLQPRLPHGELHRLRDVIGEHDLFLDAIGVGDLLRDPNRIGDLLAAAPHLGATALTVTSGGRPDDPATWTRLVETLRDLLAQAETSGCCLSLTPQPNQAVRDTGTALRLLQEVESPWLRLNLDPAPLYRAGEDPAAAVARLTPWIATARIRDSGPRAHPPEDVHPQIPGHGEIDLFALAEALKGVPGLRFVTLTIDGAHRLPPATVDWLIRRSFEYLFPLCETGPSAVKAVPEEVPPDFSAQGI